jgi:hypothetical protein
MDMKQMKSQKQLIIKQLYKNCIFGIMQISAILCKNEMINKSIKSIVL